MEIVYAIVVFIIGVVFGSFFNVVGLRVPKKESIVSPPSHCTNCKFQLNAVDLIPVLSFVFLGGKCRGCGQKISWVYPIMEFVTGFLFALAYWKLGFSLEFGVAIMFISLLVIIVVSDFAYMLIPDKVLLFFLPFIVVGRMVSSLTPWWDSILGAVVGFGILYIIAVVSRAGMGGGDIKLFFLIGAVLGTIGSLLTLFFASIIGVLIGSIILKFGRKDRKTPIPFGPSIALAAVIVYFYGNTIMDWYLELF